MMWLIFGIAGVVILLVLAKTHQRKQQRKLLAELRQQWAQPVNRYRAFSHISRYFKHEPLQPQEHEISDRTCHDLDFDSLFELLDRTQSVVGQQYLYKQLRRPKLQPELLLPFEELVTFFEQKPEVQEQVQLTLAQLNQPDAYHICSLFQQPLPEKPKWFAAVPMLAAGTLLMLLLFPFFPVLLIWLLPVFIINLIIHYYNKN
ncbi:MAG: heme exporter protein CcmD, partial [Hymenobacteraceae bacterium]|nr:heme exporter protein CcmD [Hymenobacteraceae bacterium]MDX5395638.1 heme exporter protein CcmD [Hymenobacteraceae bacterium]MDX5511692.1 heme exporter protein CcmD [Hymenobacteraceae bacterium]